MTLEARELVIESPLRPLLRNVNIAIKPGELHVMLGPNGAGKSSLLKALSGLSQADSGQVLLKGQPLESYAVSKRSQFLVTLLQEQPLDFPFSVKDVVAMGSYPRDRSMMTCAPVVDDALDLLDISGLAERAYTSLSGGEKQRTHLARIFVQVTSQTEYLLLDEPLKGVDLKHQLQIMQHLKKLATYGKGVFIILHDLSLAAQFADTVSLISEGEVVCTGSVAQVMTTPQLSAVFQTSIGAIEAEGKSLFFAQGSTNP